MDTNPHMPARRPRRALRRWALRIAFLPLVLGLYLGGLLLTDNFHAVLPGELYRSAQPDAAAIAQYSKQYGIRTVINLRGENDDAPWYRQEVDASKQAGVTHLDFRMSAKRELTQVQAEQLVAMMRAAPKPLWIHCRSGSDRTGLASALYLLAIKHDEMATATHQLSLRYGHLSAFGLNNTVAMDRTFDAVGPALSQQKASSLR